MIRNYLTRILLLRVCFNIYIILIHLKLGCLGYKPKNGILNWVRIYFDTPTFDRITKDEKANFETKLSVIGGTMGLLTGFSLISSVEIVYFGVKIFLGAIMKRMKTENKVPTHVK